MLKFVIMIKHVNFPPGTSIALKVDQEEAELEMCRRHKRYFKEAKAIGTNAWQKQNQFMDQVDIKRDISLFIARYSSKLGILFMCDGCLEEIRGCWYKCLHCIDMNFCVNCYKTGRKSNEHLNLHEIIELRLVKVMLHSLRKKCPYSELFWSVFFCIRTEYGQIRSME